MDNVQKKTATGKDKIRFAGAYLAESLLWMGGLAIVSAVLLPQHLRDAVGASNSTTVFGYLNAATAIASLVANLIFGNFSDRTRSKYGRRTPWVIWGGIIGGIFLFLVGTSNNAWVIGFYYCVCMFGLNMMLAPAIATISDRVPDDLRATVSAFNSAGTTVGNALGTMIGAYFITKQIPGFMTAGILMALAGLATVIVWPKEGSSENMPPVEGGLKSLLSSFRPPVKGARDFWLAFGGRSLLIFSYYMIINYQLYILQDYIGLSTTKSAATISVMSVITMIVALVGSLSFGAISDKLGKRKSMVNIASLLMAIGFLLPWIMKSAFSMMLFAGFAGFGYAVYGAVDQALNVDVLPNEEEAGKDLGILNMATTLGQTAGPIVTSALVVAGGYHLVFPVAIAFAVLACVFIHLIKSAN